MPKLLTKALNRTRQRPEPLWKGPLVDGVTSSLLQRYLVCRERFRILVVEGLKPKESFNARMEFGNMWHAAEEALAGRNINATVLGNRPVWENALFDCAKNLTAKYPFQREEINLWHEKAKAMFSIYVDYWSKHQDVKERTPLLQEQVFDVPYVLMSGREVKLRGKWDAVDRIGKGKDARVCIQENKTKSAIDGQKLTRQLSFDVQTMTYVVAFLEWREHEQLGVSVDVLCRFAGARYNVIRRSAHKSVDSMLKKVNEDMAAGRDGEWFARWNVDVSACDVEKFKRECLDPVLENLCDDFEWWEHCKVEGADVFDYQDRANSFPKHQNRHFRFPFGCYAPLMEGGGSDLDGYLEDGSLVGLQKVDTLFPELE